jgi:hypothetical protein
MRLVSAVEERCRMLSGDNQPNGSVSKSSAASISRSIRVEREREFRLNSARPALW